jgi:PhnB protein
VTGRADGAIVSRMETVSRGPTLVPLLVVIGAARAIAFYVQALGATEIARYVHGEERAVSHADLAVYDAVFSVTEEARHLNSDAPDSLGGSPVVLQLRVDDVAALFQRVRGAGATVVFPLQEFCGERMGRVRDPFGHLWILTQRLEDLSSFDIQRRRDEMASRSPAKARATRRKRRRP